MARLERDPGVLSVEPNVVFDFSIAPNDPLYGESFYSPSPWSWQWGISGWPSLGLQQAWEKTFGTAYVAVLDTGIQENHPDLSYAFRKVLAYRPEHFDRIVDEPKNWTLPGGGAFPYAGHGTHVAGIIAANSSAPWAPAGYPSLPNQGVAGVCWQCSLMVIKVGTVVYTSGGYAVAASLDLLASGLHFAVSGGAQVVNLSLGQGEYDCFGSTGSLRSFCSSLAFAVERDVIVVAAAGNSNANSLQFPASDERVIPVGGEQGGGVQWRMNDLNFFGSNVGPGMRDRGLVAPAREVLSTVYSGWNWNPPYRCGDGDGVPNGPLLGSLNPQPSDGYGYGVCTGTSMAAPHISGAAALLRTVDPLIGRDAIRDRLRQNGHNYASRDNSIGSGRPNVGSAVDALVAGTNRLTPLFSFVRWTWSQPPGGFFYTVVPQRGAAALAGTLPPHDFSKIGWGYEPTGNTISSSGSTYSFPGGSQVARAQLWVFSTHINPRNASQPLAPLRSYVRCGSGRCSTKFMDRHSVHAYSTNLAEENGTLSNYDFVGIEGYVYSTNYPQPSGTVKLMRGFRSSTNEFALYPESEDAGMYGAGYTQRQVIGYAHANLGTRPTTP